MAILGRHTVWSGLSALIVIWSMLLGWNWPFTQHTVVIALQHETGQKVKVGIFHATFFPPGYVAENLTLTRRTAQIVEDPITVRKFVVVARWTDLLLMRKRLEQARIVGLRMRSPMGAGSDGKPAHAAQDRQPRFLEVGRVEINDAVFAFPTTAKDPDPFTITVQSFWLNHVNQRSPSLFKTRLLVSEPKITVRSEGQVGRWDWNDVGRTGLSGFFVIERAALNGLGGIAGDFTGSGNFRGSLRHIASVGTVDIPYFRVDGNEHSTHLFTTFRASINGLNGDTTLERAQARLNGTLINYEGAIKTEPQMPGKAASLHLSIDKGRIEDFLFLLTRKTQPSMTGDIKLQVQADIPPGAPGFLEKIILRGNFEIDNCRFTGAKTQTAINRLSKSAEGMAKSEGKTSPTTVFSRMKGEVVAQHGTAVLSHSVVAAPGARAELSGTYSLVAKTVDLRGLLQTTGKLSDTTSGFETVLLKAISPLWKQKNKSMSLVPFTVSGKAQDPTFALELKRKHL